MKGATLAIVFGLFGPFGLFGSDGVALAQDDPERLYRQGAAAYGDGRFTEAAALFERAYAIRPDVPLLYNLGLALEQAGEVARAIDAYERFLAAAPDAAERTEVERSLQTLRRTRDLQVRAEARERERERERAGARVAPDHDADAAGGADDAGDEVSPVPWIVTAAGGAVLVAGAVIALVAQGRHDEAADPGTSMSRAAELDRSANGLAVAANVAFVAGGGIAGAGLVWGIAF